MSKPGTLIVGAGQGGIDAAAALRQSGYKEPITIIGAEEHKPYQRPPLSKSYLASNTESNDMWLREDQWFAQRNISILTGQRVKDVAWESSERGYAVTEAGVRHDFSSLVIATGASPRRLQLPGTDLEGIHYLRTLADAKNIALELGTSPKMVVIGGGFIGLEIAATVRAQGGDSTVLEAAPRIIGRAVCPETSEFYRNAHEDRGTVVHTGVSILEIVGSEGKASAVRIIDAEGQQLDIPADLVVVGIGVNPEVSLAEQLGLDIENGIIVDGSMLASDGKTLVVGDAANMPFPGGPRGEITRVRLESVPNATEQARIVAATLCGQSEEYAAVPWFWSDQGEIKLQIAGLSHGYDQVVVREGLDEDKFVVAYYLNGEFIAADCVNSPRDFMALKTALRDGTSVSPDVIRDSSVSLRDVVRANKLLAA